ncbi:hypothetical protein [Methylobacterium sp. SyP6R]|uniref:hypothetical protein n=1 Tax=Methylobacterium sp. SyP6R TaxID=2718876 RepID=UPI001F264876|nr:hypothetical protein [Methylobacterium sp. SyP6R]MCF4129071.1 hypothetical protein [Methylobacterium sp. SyP6R]
MSLGSALTSRFTVMTGGFSRAFSIVPAISINIFAVALRSGKFSFRDDESIVGLITEPLRRVSAGARSATRSKSVD